MIFFSDMNTDAYIHIDFVHIRYIMAESFFCKSGEGNRKYTFPEPLTLSQEDCILLVAAPNPRDTRRAPPLPGSRHPPGDGHRPVPILGTFLFTRIGSQSIPSFYHHYRVTLCLHS